MRWSLVIVVVGCSGAAKTAPPPITNASAKATPAVVAKSDLEPGCEAGDRLPFTAGGVPGTIELELCLVGESYPHGEDAAEQGFIEREKEAYLVLRIPGQPVSRWAYHAWTDGWEWGTSVELVGVLVGGKNDALVIRRASSGPAPGVEAYSSVVHVMRFSGTYWDAAFATSANRLDVAVTKDGTLATVGTCNTAQDPANAAGCGGFDDAEPGPDYELRWDGTKVTEKITKNAAP